MAPMQKSHDEDDQSAPTPLQDDGILEILTRVSLETLAICRCVCRQWRQITYEPTFTSLYSSRTRTVSGYFIQCTKRNRCFSSFVSIHTLPPSAPPLSLDFLPKDVKIEAMAPRGIMLCTSQDYRIIPRYYVCKPATRQWVWIPNPKTRYQTRGIAIVAPSARRLEYKIIRFSETKPLTNNMQCEIFDSRSKAWRRSNDIQLPPRTLLSCNVAVSANGAVHWLTHGNSSIFAFNVCNESWRLISLPEKVKDEKRWCAKQLAKRESRLCLLVDDGEERLEIWVMASYEEQRWERREVVSLEALNKKAGTSIVSYLYSTNVVWACGLNRLTWYDICANKLTMIDSSFATHLRDFFPFESDFVPCELTTEDPGVVSSLAA